MSEPEEPSLAERLLGTEVTMTARYEMADRVKEQLEVSKWLPANLEDALAGLRPPPPSMLARSDGKHILYQGKIHWFQGEPGSMKSMLAQHAVVQVLAAGGDCLYLDYESEALDVVGRLVDMGATPDQLRAHFTYVHPEGGTHMSPGDHEAFLATVASKPWALCVLDGTTDSIAFEGLDANSGADISTWLSAIPRRLQKTGATVVVIDHVAKAAEGRGRWAIGSGHKLAGLDGVSFTLTTLVPLAKAVGKPEHTGKALVTVNKDRGGDVQALCGEDNKTIGALIITAYANGELHASLDANVEATQIDVAYEVFVTVAKVLKTYPGAVGSAVVKATGLSEHEVAACLLQMVDKGWCAVEGVGQSFKHKLTVSGQREFRESDPF